MTPVPGTTSNGDCASCGAPVFWGFITHDEDCDTSDVMAHPADLARRDQLMAMFRDVFEL
jgi:hypothetical protein